MRSLGPADPRARRGASLVELVVALTLFGIVAGTILRTFDRQVRLHATLLAILEARGQHAATHDLLAAMLRGIAPGEGDLVAVTDSSIVARLGVGTGVSCRAAGTSVTLAPDTVTNGQRLAAMADMPQPGDSLWVHDEGPTDATIDDQWQVRQVVAAVRAAGACAGSSVVDAVSASRPSWRLDVTPGLPPTVLAGAPVRLTRWGRFALYRSGSETWLGFADWNSTLHAWNGIQPVSGPFTPFVAASPSASGVAFAPRNAAGVPWGVLPAAVTSLALATRTRTRRPIRAGGFRPGSAADSMRSTIAFRNIP